MSTAPRRIETLTEQECLRLLSSVALGRIVFTQNALPAIRPVNHLLDGTTIIIRSHLGAAIVSHTDPAAGAVVAYEADDLHPDQHLGWSVIVTGTARIIRDSAAIARYQQQLRPWVAGDMDHVIAIQSEIITGIRLVDATVNGDGPSDPTRARPAQASPG
jgi:nitroimidazol reductase NimA-like FMN-containing flavoprotein (pyridoxamine 5'-phosphate oxidase superfamily)